MKPPGLIRFRRGLFRAADFKCAYVHTPEPYKHRLTYIFGEQTFYLNYDSEAEAIKELEDLHGELVVHGGSE